ncbi:MAG: MFS transporter [Deltaproteobacteria bacterium]|nr:MFS transporter [Deltaproteobacteria bacterium]
MTDKKTLRDIALVRWSVLVLISGLMLGMYWFYDFFSSIKPLMVDDLKMFTNTQYGQIISATTWANMFGVIILGGMFLDRFGIRKAVVVFGALVALGAIVTALGASNYLTTNDATKVTLMTIGRIIFGSGVEICCVVVSKTVVKWFKKHKLATAMAINVDFGRVGSAMAIGFSVDIAAGEPFRAAGFAAGLVVAGFVLFLFYLLLDMKLDKQVQESTEAGEDEKFKLRDLLDLVKNRSFLFIALLCVAFYSAVFPFMQYAPDLLVNKFGFTTELPDLTGVGFGGTVKAWLTNGSKVASLIPWGSIIFTPLFGYFIDKKGKAASVMILGSVLLIFAHLSLSVFDNVYLGYAGLFSLGIAFSLVPAAMWPSVARIVPERQLGTAYAAMFTIQNWGLGLFFWGIGLVLDLVNKDKLEAIGKGEAVYDYTIPILMLVGLGVVSIFLAFALKYYDKKQGFGLENPKK